MNDPSGGVPPQVLRHVHLICNYQYAVLPVPSIEMAARYLQEAPKVVRDLSPMAWRALTEPPRDGTVMLVWQPPSLGTQFASDGYVYADAERAFSQAMDGYSLEMWVQQSGFRPGVDAATMHARRRYRLTPPREPLPNGNVVQVDSSLWLVHYYVTEPPNQIPSRGICISDQASRMMSERNSLQAHGYLQLQHKEFMLRDRDNWPTISMPGSNSQAAQTKTQPMGYPNNVMAHLNRNSTQIPAAAPQASMPSPAKRPRHLSNGHMAPSATAIPVPPPGSHVPENEEDLPSSMDYMDVLTPQIISRARYATHQEWLEEVLNSPFDSSQIVPPDLGLGRKGELESLTKDFFDAPTAVSEAEVLPSPAPVTEQVKSSDEPVVSADPHAKRPGRMAEGKAADFTARAAERMALLESQMAHMKQEHAAQVSALEETNFWKEAEQKLRAAMPQESNDLSSTNDIVRQIEQHAGHPIASLPEIQAHGGPSGSTKAQDADMPDADFAAAQPFSNAVAVQ